MARPFRILFDLTPAFEGWSGIPQETRLLFKLLRSLDTVETAGLVQHGHRPLPRGLHHAGAVALGKRPPDAEELAALSRLIVAMTRPSARHLARTRAGVHSLWDFGRLLARTLANRPETISHFAPEGFEDFLWQSLFEKTLPSRDFTALTHGRFAVLSASRAHLDRMGRLLRGRYPPLSFDGFDALICQKPWPGRVTSGTTLVVRYHDAIPIFQPHTIGHPESHQAQHYLALRSAVREGARFVCVSAAAEAGLLKLFPAAGLRTTVIHNIVPPEYLARPAQPPDIIGIIRSRIERATCPPTANQAFYERVLVPGFPYLLVVAAIEARKNHERVIMAFEGLRARGHRSLKLILVGTPGREGDRVLTALAPWQEQGQAFILSRVPMSDLRSLYAGAAAVVCPSIAEGFDYPGVEAMLSGGVVAASDIPVHREVYGTAACYFDPYDTGSCIAALEALLDAEPSRLAGLRAAGREIGGRYLAEAIRPRWETFMESLRGCDDRQDARRIHPS